MPIEWDDSRIGELISFVEMGLLSDYVRDDDSIKTAGKDFLKLLVEKKFDILGAELTKTISEGFECHWQAVGHFHTGLGAKGVLTYPCSLRFVHSHHKFETAIGWRPEYLVDPELKHVEAKFLVQVLNSKDTVTWKEIR